MADKKQKKEQGVPVPIKLALEALKILEAEGGAAEGLKKSLPAHAMQLAKAGKEVTLEILLAQAREGIAAPAAVQKPLIHDTFLLIRLNKTLRSVCYLTANPDLLDMYR